jgi:hypothetical protein
LHSALAFASPIAAQEHDYAVGQVWAYRTAPGDEGFLIKMQEIEEIGPEGQAVTVYHISMIGVAVSVQAGRMAVQHLPVSRQTLDASVTEQIAVSPQFSDHSEGKAQWEAANGGVFTITLAQIAEILRKQVTLLPQDQTN